MVDAFNKSAAKGYQQIAHTVRKGVWDHSLIDEAYEMAHEICIWLGLIEDAPKMGFDYGSKTKRDIFPEIVNKLYVTQTEYVSLNNPYRETAWFFYEKLSMLGSADKRTLESWGDLIYVFKTDSNNFDSHLAPGYIDDLYAWIELYEHNPTKASIFGSELYQKYDFLHLVQKFGNSVLRKNHAAHFEIPFFLWSRAKMVDQDNEPAILGYQQLANTVHKALEAGRLSDQNYKFTQDLAVGLDLVNTFPSIGQTVLATMDRGSYYQLIGRLYDLRAEYININFPYVETARFLFEKIRSLSPDDVDIMQSFQQVVKALLQDKDTDIEQVLPGYLAQLLEWLHKPVVGKELTSQVLTLKKLYPVLFTKNPH